LPDKEDNFTQYVAVVGAGCSAATMPIARLVPFVNMPMASLHKLQLFIYHSV